MRHTSASRVYRAAIWYLITPSASPGNIVVGLSAGSGGCIIAADTHCVPAPFRSFAVRSEEPVHAFHARAPYGRVHVFHADFMDAESPARLAASGFERVNTSAFSDIDYATTTLQELAATAPQVADLAGQIAGALAATGVLGDDPSSYRRSVETRIDFLACCGAGFHNDVAGHWSRCRASCCVSRAWLPTAARRWAT